MDASLAPRGGLDRGAPASFLAGRSSRDSNADATAEAHPPQGDANVALPSMRLSSGERADSPEARGFARRSTPARAANAPGSTAQAAAPTAAKESPPTSATTSARATASLDLQTTSLLVSPAPAAPPVKRPSGFARPDISGTITFNAAPPVMNEIDPWADPKCQLASHATDQEVVLEGNRLADVLVFILAEGSDPHPRAGPQGSVIDIPASARQIELQMRDCQFVPRVQENWGSGHLTLTNQDNTVHDLTGMVNGRTLFHLLLETNATAKVAPLGKSGDLLEISSATQPWMRAYVSMTANPFFATSDRRGRFHIEANFNIRDGTYTLAAGHPRFGLIKQRITVTAGEPTRANFDFSDHAKFDFSTVAPPSRTSNGQSANP